MLPNVSLIVPVYNAARHLERWFECNVYAQTHRPFEIIMVNDGSTDATDEIIRSFLPRLAGMGVNLVYRTQENQGPGGAVNTALKWFTGDYLTWVDADDFYRPDAIEKRAAFLQEHPDYGFVRSDGAIFDHLDRNSSSGLLSRGNPNRFHEWIFDDLVQGTTFCSTCYMLRSSAYLAIQPGRSIYPSREGQNWQMILPMAWHYRCGFIDEPLLNVIIYPDSLSHHSRSFDGQVRMLEEHERILQTVLASIPGLDASRYHTIVATKYARLKLILASRTQNPILAGQCIEKLREIRELRIRDLVFWQCASWPCLNRTIENAHRVMHALRSGMFWR